MSYHINKFIIETAGVYKLQTMTPHASKLIVTLNLELTGATPIINNLTKTPIIK